MSASPGRSERQHRLASGPGLERAASIGALASPLINPPLRAPHSRP